MAHLEASKQHVDQLPPFLVNKNTNAMSIPNFYFVGKLLLFSWRAYGRRVKLVICDAPW